MNDQQRAAMQMALDYVAWNRNGCDRGNVLTALREALAQPQYCKECGAKQAKIDSLMLEYCPDEMTPEQLETWKNSQRFIQETTG